jgi:hypothetical protein
MKKELFLNVLLRIFATFAASGLGVVGAGAIAGVSMTKAILMAGIAGVATVIEGLSRAFLDDGKLTLTEINSVFTRFDKKSAVSDSEVAKTSTRRTTKTTTTPNA